MLQADALQALKDKVVEIQDPQQRKILQTKIDNMERFKTGSDSAAAGTPTPQPAGTPAPQSNAGGISVGGLTVPPTKQPTGTPAPQSNAGGISVGGLTVPPTGERRSPGMDRQSNSDDAGNFFKKELIGGGQQQAAPVQPAVTAQMPSEPEGDNASDVDVKIPADLGGGGTAPNSGKTPLQVGGGISIGNPEAAQETETPTKAAAGSGKKQSSSNNGSIVDYLAGKNQAFDKGSRGKLAAQYGIQNYTGTAEQNTQLLKKLQSGEKPTSEQQPSTATQPSAGTQQQPQQQGMGGIIGGASKLAGGAGNLAKKALIGDQPLGGIVGGVSKLAGGAGNLVKKALIGGGGQQQAAPVQQATAPVQQQATSTTKQAAPVQQTASTKKQTAPVQQTASNNKGYVEKPGGVDEYFKDQSDEEIKENKNIAKFVKCLSEKNYSQAHEYLKKIVNSKVEKNLYRVINKL